VLNGVGIREKFTIDVYVAALYLRERCTTGEAALAMDGPKRLVMHFVYRRITARQMVAQFRESLAHVPGAQAAQDDLEELYASLRDVERGDRLLFEYIPGRGTSTRLSGGERTHHEGDALMRVMLGLFVGQHPPTAALRDGLLAGVARTRR